MFDMHFAGSHHVKSPSKPRFVYGHLYSMPHHPLPNRRPLPSLPEWLAWWLARAYTGFHLLRKPLRTDAIAFHGSNVECPNPDAKPRRRHSESQMRTAKRLNI